MSVDNHTPFPSLAFRQYNLSGELLGVVVARGTFRLTRGGPLTVADEQYPLVMSDTYDGDPHRTPQMACTDLAPFKPGTDITFVGASFAPDGMAAPFWSCGLRVGPVSKRLKVSGPRNWRARTRKTWKGLVDRTAEDALDGWDLTEPEPVTYVPIDWRFALGGLAGRDITDRDLAVTNPIGIGLVDESRYRDMPEWPAPQIEDEDHLIRTVADRPQPAGFGPISPFWQTRAKLAGTYDEIWLNERHPLLPHDFDFHFWQAAHPDLVAEPWLRGDEDFELDHLLPGLPDLRGRLPALRLQLEIDQGQGSSRGPMVLDGVHFDMRPGVGRVFLTWRTAFPWPDRRGVPKLSMLDQNVGVA